MILNLQSQACPQPWRPDGAAGAAITGSDSDEALTGSDSGAEITGSDT